MTIGGWLIPWEKAYRGRASIEIWSKLLESMDQWDAGMEAKEAMDVVRLVEHGNGMRVVGMTGGTVNINNGVSTCFGTLEKTVV